MKKKVRRVLLNGHIIETTLPPKYIYGKYDKENGIWYYCLKASIFTKYIDCRTRVVVSRYTVEQIKDKLDLQRQFAEPGTLHAELKRYKFKNFKKTIGPVVELRSIDSVDEWLDYLDNELTDDEFKIARLREILSR
jgi:hypothetical protein